MWVYGLLLFVVILLLLISVVNIVKLSHKLISKKISNKVLCWLLSFIPILFLIIGLLIDLVNAIVVDIHLIIIVLLVKLFFRIIKKDISEVKLLSIGVIIGTIILTYGYYSFYHVVETNYIINTNKDIGMDNFKIVQISDSHLGKTMSGNRFSSYIDDINKLNPDIVVITGDFIDDNTTIYDMKVATSGLGKLKTKYGVYLINGNHDKGYYHHDIYEELKKELIKNSVILLEDGIIDITNNIVLIGRRDRQERDRVDAKTLTKDIDKNKYIIMLDHQPNDYDNETNLVDLVLSGHTHGGQLFPLGIFGVLLGSNDKTYGLETRENTTFIVNSGISDWAIKFKTGTKSEYGVITIRNNK